MDALNGGHWQRSEPLVRLLAGRWTLAVLAQRVVGERRYQELPDPLDGISYKVLTDTLRRCERDGLASRRLDPGRVETATLYQHTDLAHSLEPPINALQAWLDPSWASGRNRPQSLEPMFGPPLMSSAPTGPAR